MSLYLYACVAGKTVGIDDLATLAKSELPALRCPNCDGEMIARRGAIREHHFAHKHVECSPESYLHGLAKRVFAETFKERKTSNQPFHIVRSVVARCNHYTSLDGETCELETEEKIDLTKFFDQVRVEAGINGFVADVLLSRPQDDEVLLVEIAVSHRCEPSKIESGLRIVEIPVRSLADIDDIRAGVLRNTWECLLYNFRERVVERDVCRGQCTSHSYYLHVRPNGKATLPSATLRKVAYLGERIPSQIVKIFPRETSVDREEVLVEAYFGGAKIKDCELCEHKRIRRREGVRTGFCRKLDDYIESFQVAVGCQHYSPDKSLSARTKRLNAIRKSRELHQERRRLATTERKREEEERRAAQLELHRQRVARSELHVPRPTSFSQYQPPASREEPAKEKSVTPKFERAKRSPYADAKDPEK